jgi:hypothetical protein
MYSRNTLAAIALVVLLAACGGGSGDDNGGAPAPSPPPPPPPPPPVVNYFVGGVVNGLTGSGLLLRNAGVDLPVAAVGQFRFATAVPDGTNYDVTVATQPTQPTQTCSVSAGQGQVRGADVTSVVVDCRGVFAFVGSTPNNAATEVTRDVDPVLMFSEPLRASSVVPSIATLTSAAGPEILQISTAGNSLTIAPSRLLLPLTDYTLTVSNNLLSDSGAVLQAPVSLSFRTREAAWGTPEALTGTDANTGGLIPVSQRIVADREGRSTVIWVTSEPGAQVRRIWSRHRPAGSAWGDAVLVHEATLEEISNVATAIDDAGNVLIAWPQQDGSLIADFNRIFAKRFAPGSGWGPLQLVAQATGNFSQLQLASHTDGSAMLVAYQSAPGSNAIMSSRFTPAAGWAAMQRVDTASSVVFRPQVAVLGNDAVIAVWAQFIQGAGNDIFAARYEVASGWGQPVRVSVSNLGPADGPSLAATANGDAVVSWLQTAAGNVRYIASSYYRTGQGWDTPQRVETGTGNSDASKVAFDNNGAAHAIWRQAVAGLLHAHTSRRDPATGAWSTPLPVSSVTDSGVFEPTFIFDRRGNGLAAWYELSNANQYTVRGNRFKPAQGWGSVELIGASGPPIAPFTLSLAVDGSGTGYAVWTQQDSNRMRVVNANRFQ